MRNAALTLSLTAAVCCAVHPSAAEVVSSDEAMAILALNGNALQLSKDANDAGRGVLRAARENLPMTAAQESEMLRMLTCLDEVEDEIGVFIRDTYALHFTVMMAAIVEGQATGDNDTYVKMAMWTATNPLDIAVKDLTLVRTNLNDIEGSCSAFPLAYDKAKAMLLLVDKANVIIPPLAARVAKAAQ